MAIFFQSRLFHFLRRERLIASEKTIGTFKTGFARKVKKSFNKLDRAIQSELENSIDNLRCPSSRQ